MYSGNFAKIHVRVYTRLLDTQEYEVKSHGFLTLVYKKYKVTVLATFLTLVYKNLTLVYKK